MTIRQAIPSDKPQVLALLNEFSEMFHSPDRPSEVGGDQYDVVMADPNTYVFVADDNGRLTGLATLYLIPNIRHGHRRGHIEDFFVSSSTRNSGVGSAIFDAIKEFCRSQGVKVIKLDSGNELTAAHHFYAKNGGKTTERFFRFDL